MSTSRTRTRQERRRAVRAGGASASVPSAPPPAGARKLIPLLVILAGLYAYHNSLLVPFTFDDLTAIQLNPSIRQLGTALSPPGGDSAWSRGYAVTGRPVVNLSLAVNYALGG